MKSTYIKSIGDIRRERAVEYMQLARIKFELAVRPIYGRTRKGVAPIHIGSSILLSINNIRFLATAGHITDNAKETTLHVAGSNELVPLTFEKGYTTNPGMRREEDAYDFSVCKLSEDMYKQLGNVRYITEEEILIAPPVKANLRMVMGFPRSKNKHGIDNPGKHVAGTLWTYGSLAVNDALMSRAIGVASDDHTFLEFDHNKSFNPDGIGTHSLYPTGASGGAMFDLGNLENPERLAMPAKCQAKLIGILTEYKSDKKLIMATNMNAVLYMCSQLS